MATNVAKLSDYKSRKAPKGGRGNMINPGRIKPYAEALMAAIKAELNDADFFSREDLLHLTVFDHIATISRYAYVCHSVRFLVDRGDLSELGRTELALRSKARFYASKKYTEVPVHKQFEGTIRRVLGGMSGSPFTVMDLVNRWEFDPHLTLNTKRVIARRNLNVFIREGLTEKVDLLHFKKVTKS